MTTVRGYARQLLRLKPPNYVGHNPLGGWMVVQLLGVLLATVISGLFSGGDHGTGGPSSSPLWLLWPAYTWSSKPTSLP